MMVAAEETMMAEEEMGMVRVKVDTTMALEGRVGSVGGLRQPYYAYSSYWKATLFVDESVR